MASQGAGGAPSPSLASPPPWACVASPSGDGRYLLVRLARPAAAAAAAADGAPTALRGMASLEMTVAEEEVVEGEVAEEKVRCREWSQRAARQYEDEAKSAANADLVTAEQRARGAEEQRNRFEEELTEARATAAEMDLHHEQSRTGWVLTSSMPTLRASAGGAH